MQRGVSMEFQLRMIFFSLLLMVVHTSSVEAARVREAIPSTTHAVLPFSTSREKGYYRDEGLEGDVILMSADCEPRAAQWRRGGGDRGRRGFAAGPEWRSASICLYHL